MRRRSRSLESEWYDLFADWELADQEAALRTLTELHRQAVRQAQRKPKGKGAVFVGLDCTCDSDPLGRCVVHGNDLATKEPQ
jgi:hypothetical protein